MKYEDENKTQLVDGELLDEYWCDVCQRFIKAESGVIVHDDIPHPENMVL